MGAEKIGIRENLICSGAMMIDESVKLQGRTNDEKFLKLKKKS